MAEHVVRVCIATPRNSNAKSRNASSVGSSLPKKTNLLLIYPAASPTSQTNQTWLGSKRNWKTRWNKNARVNIQRWIWNGSRWTTTWTVLKYLIAFMTEFANITERTWDTQTTRKPHGVSQSGIRRSGGGTRTINSVSPCYLPTKPVIVTLLAEIDTLYCMSMRELLVRVIAVVGVVAR